MPRDSAVANTSSVEVTVMDGAAVVICIPIGESKTFAEHAKYVGLFIPRARVFGKGGVFRKTQGVDIVQDVYLNDNLKLSRETEGQEQASGCLVMPSFQGTENTSYEMMTVRTNSSITMGTGCVSKNTADKVIVSKNTDGLPHWSQEEADTRRLFDSMGLHLFTMSN